MKIKNTLASLFICSSVFFVGCATTTLSEKQRASLTTVSVSTYEMAEDAYHEPNARQSPNLANSSGVAGGLIGSLVGSAIDASVMASQQKEFAETNEQHFQIIEKMMPTNLPQDLEQSTKAALSRDAWLGTRVVEDSPNSFTKEVASYGLSIRSKTSDDDVKLAFVIKSQLTLLGNNNKKMFTQHLVVESRSAYLLSEYAASPSLIQQAYQECLKQYESQLTGLLNQQFGRY